jgi:hypothetical protein
MSRTLSLKIPGFDTPMNLPADRINEGVLLAFNHGQCHALALALHELTGLPLRLEVSRDILALLRLTPEKLLDLTSVPNYAIARYWSHALVLLGPDQYLDVSGVSSRPHSPLTTHFIVPTTPDQILALSRVYRSGDAPNLEVARHFAPLVLREYEINY